MKNTLFVLLISIQIISCKNQNQSSVDSNETRVSTTKKDKFLVESQRDIESLDSTIEVNIDDFERIGMEIFPSFDEAHYIDLDFLKREIGVYQKTQTNELYISGEYFELPNSEKEDYLYQKMKENKTKDFHFKVNQKEMNDLLNAIKLFKQAKYKVKSVQQYDGATFYMNVYEKDTIVFMGTNSPSSHQKKFLMKLFETVENHAEDSITKRNINRLKEYL